MCVGKPLIDKGVLKPPLLENGVVRVEIGTPATVYVTDNINVTIDCKISSGDPPMILTWFHNRQLVQSRGNLSSITVTVNNAKDIDGDVFTCKVENEMGYDTRDTYIRNVKNNCVRL